MARSFIVVQNHNKEFEVKATHWAPGYTPAHQPTAREAISYSLARRGELINNIKEEVRKLTDLSITVIEAEREARENGVEEVSG